MGYFVEIAIAEDKCVGLKECGACVRACPVNIFAEKDGLPVTVPKNEDECILCNLCMDECAPDAISISKKY